MANITEIEKRVKDFYAEYNPEEPKQLEQVTSYFTDDVLIDLLDNIIHDNSALQTISERSYRHNNGFDKIVLSQDKEAGWKLRLHIWWPETHSVEDLHLHRWNFSTRMITGMYENNQYYVNNFAVHKGDFSESQKQVLNGISNLFKNYLEEEKDTIKSEILAYYKNPEQYPHIKALLDGITISEKEALAAFEFPIAGLQTADEEKLLERVYRCGFIEASDRMDKIHSRIRAAKELWSDDAISIGLKGGRDTLQQTANPLELCEMLGVTEDELKDFASIYVKYNLPAAKKEGDDFIQPPSFTGYAEMAGPFVSQEIQGANRLQSIGAAHRLIIDPKLSTTTSTIMITEAPRSEDSYIINYISLKEQHAEHPAMQPDILKTTLTNYRDLLVTRKIMQETLQELTLGENKPEGIRIRGVDENSYFLEAEFLARVREFRNGTLGGGEVIEALDAVLGSKTQDEKECFERTMARNEDYFEKHIFDGDRSTYFRDEQAALELENKINAYADKNNILVTFTSASANSNLKCNG